MFNLKNLKGEKAQVWYTDFMLGILIFVIVIFIYYGYANSVNQDPSNTVFDLLMDAKAISSSLIKQGSPDDWNETNVEVIGITDGNQRIVQSKLDLLDSMSYDVTKTKLRTSYDYYVYFTDLNGSVINLSSVSSVGKEPVDHDNLISVVRVLIYDSQLVNMVVQVWQ